MTYIITKKEVESVLDAQLALDTVEKAFRAHGLGKVQMPPKSYLQFEKGDLRSMPAYIRTDEWDIAGIKSVNVHPFNDKLPTVMATILLTDPANGYNIAILDGTLITRMRTGGAGGLAAKYLSREESRVAGFVGCGAQAYSQIDCLMLVRKIGEVKAFDVRLEAIERFCKYVEEKYKIKAIRAGSVEEAVKGCDIVTTVTPSSTPLVKKEWIAQGTHINAIGADAHGKQELYSDLTKSCKIIIDEWSQASHSGEINVPITEKIIGKKNIYAQLGEIVAGKKQGRKNKKEITMFDSTGLAIQDVSVAFVVLQRLDKEKLTKIDFF
jgi:alanine dehydrogenase